MGKIFFLAFTVKPSPIFPWLMKITTKLHFILYISVLAATVSRQLQLVTFHLWIYVDIQNSKFGRRFLFNNQVYRIQYKNSTCLCHYLCQYFNVNILILHFYIVICQSFFQVFQSIFFLSKNQKFSESKRAQLFHFFICTYMYKFNL